MVTITGTPKPFSEYLSERAASTTVTNLLGAEADNDVVKLAAANLNALAGLTLAADTLPYGTGAGAMATTSLTTFARTLIDDADAATMRTTLGLVIGTNVQAFDAQLAAVAGISPANGSFIRWTSSTAAVAQAIIGTVSQSGGVATGAIVERGSNANGEYMRLADGTQICWYRDATGQAADTAVGSNFRTSADGSWTFPVSFASSSTVFAAAVPEASSRWGVAYASSNTTALYRNFSSTNSATAVATILHASGRWF